MLLDYKELPSVLLCDSYKLQWLDWHDRYESGTDVMVGTNYFLISSHLLIVIKVVRTCGFVSHVSYERTILLNGHSIKVIPNDLLLYA